MEKWKLEKYSSIAHDHSIYNKEELDNSKKCGCFYCLKIFDPKEIKEWIEENNGKKTAMCPYCEIDSIIAESDEYELNNELLKFMNEYWF